MGLGGFGLGLGWFDHVLEGLKMGLSGFGLGLGGFQDYVWAWVQIGSPHEQQNKFRRVSVLPSGASGFGPWSVQISVGVCAMLSMALSMAACYLNIA